MEEEWVYCLITQIQSALSSQDAAAAAMGSPRAHLFTYLFRYRRMHTLIGWGRLFIVGRQGSECACIRVWLLEQEARTHISDSLSDKSDVGRRAMNKAYNDKIIFSVGIFGANVGLLSKAPSCAWCLCVMAHGMCGRDGVLGGGPTF
jgi:hypothetical protein